MAPGGLGESDADDPACLLGAAWRPGPAGRFRVALPNRRSAPNEASPDAAPSVRHPGHTLGSPRAGGLGAPAGEPGQAEHLCATPTLPLGRPRPPGRGQGGSFLFLPLCQLCSHQPSPPLEQPVWGMEIACPCRRPSFTKDAGNLRLGAP